MFTDRDVDKLIQPVLMRQDNINSLIINTLADKVNEIGKLSASDIKKLQKLVLFGIDIRVLNAELARLTNLQVTDIKKIIKETALDSYIDAKYLYDYRHKPFKSIEKNTPMQNLITAIGNATAKQYVNIANSKAIGFLIGDKFTHRNLKFRPIETTYQQIIDEAIQYTKTGLVDYRVAMRRALKQLSDSGVRRLSYESGYTQRLDTAVRRNISDGIHAIQQAMQDEIGKQIGADAKELSAHANSALDHEPIQGHIFLNEEFEKLQNNEDFTDINNVSFTAIERAIGMWNCRHLVYAFVVGSSKPKYTQDQLNSFIEKNHEGFILPNGKHLTMYECTQMQRQLETRIRYAKEEQMVWQRSGDVDQAKKVRQKIEQLINEYKIFSKNCGLSVSPDRIKVSGYTAKIM